MGRRIKLKLIESVELRREYSVWRRGLCTNIDDCKRFEQVFLRVFMDKVLRDLGKRKDLHFVRDVTSGTTFEGIAQSKGNEVLIRVYRIKSVRHSSN